MILSLGMAMATGSEAREPTHAKSLRIGCTADFFTNTYYESYAACRAYIIGIADVMSAGGSVDGRKACIPDNASKADVTDSVVAWLRSRSDRRHGYAHAVVAEAIADNYPCN